MIHPIPARDLPAEAARIEPFLENFAARSHGRWTVRALWEALIDGRMQAWVAGDFKALCLTRITERAVCIDFCAGSDRTEWQDALDDTLAEWARALGKERIFAMTRPGWAKLAKARGWREIHREYVRDV